MRTSWFRRDLIQRNGFSILRWGTSQTFRKIWEVVSVRTPASREERQAAYQAYDDSYQKGVVELPASLIEKTVAADVAEAIREEGVLVFPPVFFRIWSNPKLLVVSRRDRIGRIYPEELLRPDLTNAEAEEIERFVEQSNPELCAFVMDIGGFALVPPIVDFYDSKTVVEIAAHEWCHTHLLFFPLGLSGALAMVGAEVEPEVISVNELTCKIVGREIQERVARKYEWQLPNQAPVQRGSLPDYGKEIRSIRQEVDRLLGLGKVEEAEAFMKEAQASLARYWQVRKINQAFFAFNGTYGGGAAGDDPTPRRVAKLRENSGSLKEFLEKIRRVGNSKSLNRLLKEEGIE